ncbi:MAG: hypothetical protein L0170_09655 [Acidobacteria bacterium]|nr:hypothetical protein [Acidobacteriota bacterium]
MRPKTRPSQSKLWAGRRPDLPIPSGKRHAEGWLRRRRVSTLPWKRGRIRPSTCRDVAKKGT